MAGCAAGAGRRTSSSGGSCSGSSSAGAGAPAPGRRWTAAGRARARRARGGGAGGKSTTRTRARAGARLVVCRQGGGGSVGGSGLWIPGSGGMGNGGASGGGMGGPGGPDAGGQVGKGILEPAVPNVAKRNYRPPAGFMDKKIILDEADPSAAYAPAGELRKKEELIEELRMSGAGAGGDPGAGWFRYADMLAELKGAHGMDSNDISLVCEIPPIMQDKWVTAGNIRRTLLDDRTAEGVGSDDAVAGALDRVDAIDKLHAMRFMTLGERRDAIRMVVERAMDIGDTLDLVKAYKQYVDLEGEKVGFGSSARERLAYMFYRKALEETRRVAARKRFAERALSFAERAGSRSLCESILEADGIAGTVEKARVDTSRVGAASIELVRLERNETSFVTMPYLGDLSQLTPAEVEGAAGVADTVGDFRVFSPGAGQWIALPMWQALLHANTGRARKLFALTVSSWRRFPGVRIDQLDDERLLVICEVPAGSAKPSGPVEVVGNKYYLTWAAEGTESNTTNKGINVRPGNEIAQEAAGGDVPFAKVVLTCLPPN